MLCCRICAAPVQIRPQFAPWNSPDGDYPLFRCYDEPAHTSSSSGDFSNAEQSLTDFKLFRNCLRKQVPKCTIDSHLSSAELQEMFAFESMVELNLKPAYLHSLWVDEYNFSCVTSRWYGQQLLFPYGLYYVYKKRSAAKSYVHACLGADLNEKRLELQMMKKALFCINLLSAKLGDQKYFFGNKPTSFDALVFGYLAPLVRLPLPNDKLQAHIKNCHNLMAFIDSIISIYLPLSEQEITAQQICMKQWLDRKSRVQAEMRHKTVMEEADKQEYPLRDKILFGVAAAVLSLIAAVHVGLIDVKH
uniref:Metaxin n=1 Tax=Romanomermis culicivorax TaxID=13658 RepID=A0A915KAK5_ROMCU